MRQVYRERCLHRVDWQRRSKRFYMEGGRGNCRAYVVKDEKETEACRGDGAQRLGCHGSEKEPRIPGHKKAMRCGRI